MALSFNGGASSVDMESLPTPVAEYFFDSSGSHKTLIRNPAVPQTDAFTYQPLSPGQIRVLYILPGLPDSPIQCILAPAEFRDGGAYFEQLVLEKDREVAHLIHNRSDKGKNVYNALSYVWGDPTATEIIFVNCYAFPITRNLYEALKAIRGDSASYTVWADAICINQKDVVEKAEQISLMRKIYDSATLIIAFLGASTQHTDSVFDAIERLADKLPSDADRLQAEPEDLVANSGFDPESDLGESALLGLEDICKRPYWSRAWIQQEFTTNTNTSVKCGNKSVRKWQLISICTFLLQYQAGTRRLIAEQVNPSAILNYNMVHRQLNPTGFRDQGATYFMQCLHFSRHLSASDIRDKVFAMLPFLREHYLEPRGKDSSATIADYTLSASRVYGSEAMWCISNDQTLDALGYVDHGSVAGPNTRLVLPSWVPQWSCASFRQPFIKLIFPENDISKRAYNASGGFQSDSNFHLDFVINKDRGEVGLTCMGFKLDRIVRVTKPQNEGVDLDVSIEKSWAPENPNDVYEYTSETMRTAYLRTIHADMKSYDFKPYLAIERGFPSDYDPFVNDQILSKDRGLLKVASRGRQLAYTAGGLMALVPSGAEEGDEIFILKNGSVAYVLKETRTTARADEEVLGEDPSNGVRIVRRDREEGPLMRVCTIAYSFVLIGEAYVHGFMDGEALKLLGGPIGGLLDQAWEEIKIV